MTRSKRNDQPVLLNLPIEMLAAVDLAAHEQGVTRTRFLRQAIDRNLRHYQKVERRMYALLNQMELRPSPPNNS